MHKFEVFFLRKFFPKLIFESWLPYVFLTSLFFHILAVFYSEGFHRPDEHLGMMRMTALNLDIFSYQELIKVNWEIPAGIRSFAQPMFYSVIIKGLRIIGIDNPFSWAFVLRLVSSSLAFLSLYLFAFRLMRLLEKGSAFRWCFTLLFLSWYFPFFHARTTTENFGITFFLLGFSTLLTHFPQIAFHQQLLKPYKKEAWRPEAYEILLGGFLIGWSLVFRFQMGIVIFITGLWVLIYTQLELKRIFLLVLVILLPLGINLYLDYLGYGRLTFSLWNYIDQNMLKDVASGFGTSPWYYYLTKVFLKGVPPLSLFFIIPILWLWYARPGNLITWITFSYVLIHSLTPHKELRFIFPIGIFSPVALYWFVKRYQVQFKKFEKINWLRHSFTALNLVLLTISSVKPAYGPIQFYKFLYQQDEKIEKIYTMGIIRDQLKFYLKNPIKFETQESLTKLESLIEKEEKTWILTVHYDQYKYFSNKERCQRRYQNYPQWLLQFKNGDYMKRSKVWALFECI